MKSIGCCLACLGSRAREGVADATSSAPNLHPSESMSTNADLSGLPDPDVKVASEVRSPPAEAVAVVEPTHSELIETGSKEESGQKLLIRTAISVLVLFGAVGLGALFLKPQLEAAGQWFVEQFGMLGMFLGVFASDAFGVPIPPDTYLVAAVTGGADPVSTIAVASVASVLGGNVAYWFGKKASQWRMLKRVMERFRERGERIFAKWGIWAVVISAWTPVPFMVICWFAGVFNMPYKQLFWSTMTRVPRHIVYFYIIVLGWSAGELGS